MSSPLRVLVADDEEPARRHLLEILDAEEDLQVVGTCADGLATIEAIAAHEPDLVFLDIRMPGASGLEVVESVGPEAMPAVVFTTAYDEHAVTAFEINAVDYVLKPFDRERLRSALARVRERHSPSERRGPLEELVRQRSGSARIERIAARSSDRFVFLQTAEVDWIEAAGNYMRLHVGDKTYLQRSTLGALEAQLANSGFLRIHRSRLVNLERVRELAPLGGGEYEVVLQSGARVTSSRAWRESLLTALGVSE